jgi:single-strand DNA-binding protein
MNVVHLLGRLGRDPEYKQLENTEVVKFSMATSEKYKDKELTEWHNIIFFGKIAGVLSKYLQKGDMLQMSGKITTRSYEDKEGNKKYVTEIIGSSFNFIPNAKKEKQSSVDTLTADTDEINDYPF